MNEKNTEKLLRDFPRLYRGLRCFACGDGWFPLIHKLSADIENEAMRTGTRMESEQWPQAIQVKEKFGTLRYYIVAPDAEDRDSKIELSVEARGGLMSFRPVAKAKGIFDLIEAAESASGSICEECGQPASLLSNGGWWRTLCRPCDDRRREEARKEIARRMEDQ